MRIRGVWFGVLVLCGMVVEAGAQTSKIDRMYVFGDSYSDIGEGYLDGNGPTAVAYLADWLGFKLWPSNTADVKGKSLDYAVSGAQSGSGAGHRLQTALLGYGMQNQVADFSAKVHAKEIGFDPATTLFVLAGGLNDGGLPTGSTAANEKDEIRKLYALGARRFIVTLLTTEIPGFGVTGRKINPSLETIPAELMPELKGAAIGLSHWGMFYDEVLRHPEQYGITNVKDACSGREIFSQMVMPCAAPQTYYYYHAAHPSTVTHKAVGEMMYREIMGKASN